MGEGDDVEQGMKTPEGISTESRSIPVDDLVAKAREDATAESEDSPAAKMFLRVFDFGSLETIANPGGEHFDRLADLIREQGDPTTVFDDGEIRKDTSVIVCSLGERQYIARREQTGYLKGEEFIPLSDVLSIQRFHRSI